MKGVVLRAIAPRDSDGTVKEDSQVETVSCEGYGQD